MTVRQRNDRWAVGRLKWAKPNFSLSLGFCHRVEERGVKTLGSHQTGVVLQRRASLHSLPPEFHRHDVWAWQIKFLSLARLHFILNRDRNDWKSWSFSRLSINEIWQLQALSSWLFLNYRWFTERWRDILFKHLLGFMEFRIAAAVFGNFWWHRNQIAFKTAFVVRNIFMPKKCKLFHLAVDWIGVRLGNCTVLGLCLNPRWIYLLLIRLLLSWVRLPWIACSARKLRILRRLR